MLENCVLQCNKKAHPRGSLRFCAILLAKPFEEMKNLMNMGKTCSCKTCFTPMSSRYGHETNRCPLRMMKCLFCNGQHPGVVCNTVPIEKKIEEYTKYVKNKTMVFHQNIEEVQPSYLDTPDTRADNGEKIIIINPPKKSPFLKKKRIHQIFKNRTLLAQKKRAWMKKCNHTIRPSCSTH